MAFSRRSVVPASAPSRCSHIVSTLALQAKRCSSSASATSATTIARASGRSSSSRRPACRRAVAMQHEIDVQLVGRGIVAPRRVVARRRSGNIPGKIRPIRPRGRQNWFVITGCGKEYLGVIVIGGADESRQLVTGQRHSQHLGRNGARTADLQEAKLGVVADSSSGAFHGRHGFPLIAAVLVLGRASVRSHTATRLMRTDNCPELWSNANATEGSSISFENSIPRRSPLLSMLRIRFLPHSVDHLPRDVPQRSSKRCKKRLGSNPIALATRRNSTTSRRCSACWYLETNDCGFRNRFALTIEKPRSMV
jgi:hypothetical protein